MDKPSTEVVRFASKQKPRAELEPIDQAGHAVIGLLKEAADIAEVEHRASDDRGA